MDSTGSAERRGGIKEKHISLYQTWPAFLPSHPICVFVPIMVWKNTCQKVAASAGVNWRCCVSGCSEPLASMRSQPLTTTGMQIGTSERCLTFPMGILAAVYSEVSGQKANVFIRWSEMTPFTFPSWQVYFTHTTEWKCHILSHGSRCRLMLRQQVNIYRLWHLALCLSLY